jgi:hypothetical protein
MRVTLLLALAACGTTDPELTCDQVPRSLVNNHVVAVVSGENLVGVSWAEKVGESEPVHHAALVFPDGSHGPDTFITDGETTGTAGNASVLWHARASGFSQDSQTTATLQRADGNVIHLALALDATFTSSVAFDGQRYQLFWVDQGTPRRAFQRTLDEDGTLGEVHALAHDGFVAYMSATSDGRGTTFVRIEETGYIVDGATGALTKVWSGDMSDRTWGGPSFYFDGHWYIDQSYRLKRVDAATNAVATVSLQGVSKFHPTTSSLYVRLRDGGLFELDRDLQIVEQLFTPGAFGTLDDDRILLEGHYLDPETLAPGYVDVARAGATPWRTPLAIDSPVSVVEVCDSSKE